MGELLGRGNIVGADGFWPGVVVTLIEGYCGDRGGERGGDEEKG